MPGLIKIGITEGAIEERMKGLDTTSVPFPFRFYYAIESERYKEIEDHIHDVFATSRVRDNREFFKVDPERAVAALKIAGCPEVKMQDEIIDSDGNKLVEENYKINKYKKRYSFSAVNIPIGSELSFTRDEKKKCKVVSDNEVEYSGERYSLSKLAEKFLIDLGYKWKSVQGPAFFEYNGKTLTEIKRELENTDDESNDE